MVEWMQMFLWEQDPEFASIHRQMLVVANVVWGLLGDKLEGESPLGLSLFPGEVEAARGDVERFGRRSVETARSIWAAWWWAMMAA